jgi:predicted DNA binding CopG/RHH family protein
MHIVCMRNLNCKMINSITMDDTQNMNRNSNDAPARSRKKTRVTMYLDPDIPEAFRIQASDRGMPYQTLINQTLRHTIHPETAPLTVETLRRVLREELARHASDQRQPNQS